MIIVTEHDEETTTMAVVAGALAVIRSQEWSGADNAISHSCQRKRCSMEGAQGTRTSTKTASEDLHISSSSAGNSFVSVEHFMKGCKPSNRWPTRYLTTLHHRRLIRQQMWCSRATKLLQSIMASHGSQLPKKRHSRHHEDLCS
jgi:hypothetical protein